MKSPILPNIKKLAPFLAVVVFVVLGTWALRLQALQARDVLRKHGIEDIENALNRYEKNHGTYPPDSSNTWCGVISANSSKDVKAQIEESLRKDKKYAKADKKFPTDPVYGNTTQDYVYWKTSPVSFELLAKLDEDKNGSRSVPCSDTMYDYGVVSFLRNQF